MTAGAGLTGDPGSPAGAGPAAATGTPAAPVPAAAPVAAPGQTRRLLLRGPAGAVGRCRDFTREALADWEWIRPAGAAPEDPEAAEERLAVVEDVLLLVSEVVTNACLHAGGPTELVLRHGPTGLRVEVTDHSTTAPRMRRGQDAAQPGGHGLVVLGRLARSWGWAPAPVGKTVWLEVDPPRPAA
ncbi:ATP-binding protein [Streptomyces sp. NPDC097619]|uniref:ATP-binding protein n=1 Tax=Streptomyces sp. NPDC097619 TaxID=3157228 RepID=UPI00331C0789